jgi:hypothetical protein
MCLLTHYVRITNLILLFSIQFYNNVATNVATFSDSSDLSKRLSRTYEGFVTEASVYSLSIHSLCQTIVPLLSIKNELRLFKLWEEFHYLLTKEIGNIRSSQLKQAKRLSYFLLSIYAINLLIVTIVRCYSPNFLQQNVFLLLTNFVKMMISIASLQFLPQFEDIR